MAIASKKSGAAQVVELAPAATHAADVQAPDASTMFESIAAPAREMQENLRKAAEKGIEESRAAYARVRSAAEEATESLETSYGATYRGLAEMNAKAVDAMRANAEAGFGFFKALAHAKSLPEVFELQSEHARKNFEVLSFQGKEFAALAQKIAADATAPLKAMMDKVVTASQAH
jgi:phasin